MVNGYHLLSYSRISTSYNILVLYKYDSFGAEIRYSILLTDKIPSNGILGSLTKIKNRTNSKEFAISQMNLELDFDSYTYEEFYKKIGGVVNTGLVRSPVLSGLMNNLGLNLLSEGLEGAPNDLLEIYSKECLQYLFKSPARRYGKDRSFERLPDGVLLVKNSSAFLFDSKAYSNGFEFTSDDINRFEKYIEDFSEKYSHLFTVKSFIVISGKFNDSDEAILNRSTDLLSRAQVPIACIEAKTLAEMVAEIMKKPDFQQSIDWNQIFVRPVIKLSNLTSQIKKIEKDRII